MAEANNTPDVETTARGMGWLPKEEFHGDEKKWVDASTFVKRGEEFIPFLKHNNKTLEQQVQLLRNQLKEKDDTIEEIRGSVEELRKLSTEETKRAVKAAKARLRAEIKKAREDDDVDREMELLEELDEANEALRDADEAPKEKPKAKPASPQADPAHAEWVGSNPWFGVDHVKSGLAMGIANQMRAEGTTLTGKPFYDELSRRLDGQLNPKKRTPSRVESGGAGKGEGEGESGVKGFDDLPAAAKQVCRDQEKQFVGEKKAFKTREAWYAHYVSQYFAGEEA